MKISQVRQNFLRETVKTFRTYKLRPYNENEKMKDLRNLSLHEQEKTRDETLAIFNVCCITMIKKRLLKYENHKTN